MGLSQSLDRLSDALQIPIHYQDGDVFGNAVAHYTPLPKLDIELFVSARKFFFYNQSGLVAHIIGDLYILVSHFEETNNMSAFVIDGNQLYADGVGCPPEMLISKKMSLREVVEALRPAIVQAFMFKNGHWQPFNLPAKA